MIYLANLANLRYSFNAEKKGRFVVERYKTRGTCSQEIDFEISPDGTIESVQFIGGCSGNTQGVAALIRGMNIDEAISRIDGIRCGFRPTSCPDQLARALKKYKAEHGMT
jgi:uncharacterized protein (TIGR03905 family)